MAYKWGRFSRKSLRSLAECTRRQNIWEGAVRSSKSVTADVAWLLFVEQAPPGDLVMCGKTSRTLKRNVLRPLEEMLDDRYFTYSEGNGEGTILGRRFDVIGANDERAEKKLQGATYAGAYCDELSTYPEGFYRMLLSRLSVDGARLFATTNPDSPFHWLKVEVLDRAADLDLATWSFRLEDNLTLPASYVANLKREYTGLWYRRYIQGEWCRAEGAVYDQWDEAVHLMPEDAPDPVCSRYYLGIDYGTSNPFVLLLVGWRDGVYHVLREYVWDARQAGRQRTDAQYADDLVRFAGDLQFSGILVDPSAASFRVELANRGIRTTAAQNDVLDGIRTVASLLGQGRLVVHPRCVRTRAEFAAYAWDEKAREDRPLKTSDHCMDAVRYVCHTLEQPAGGSVWVDESNTAAGYISAF
jgi:PBSX family phage terminase large subunit